MQPRHLVPSRFTAFASLFLVLLASGCGQTPEGNHEEGQRWYLMHNCQSCHGPQGNDGRAVAIAPLDLSYTAFVRRLRTKESPIMPYYPEDKISDQDAADIHTFLKGTR